MAATAHEGQAFQQVHVLLVLDQRPGQRRDRLGRIALAQHRFTDVVGHQQFQPVHQFGRRGLLFQAGHFAHVEKDVQCFADQVFLDVRVMHIDDALQSCPVREGDVVEEAATQEGVRQFLLVIGGNDDDRALFGFDRFIDFVNVELHLVEFLQQVVGELDVGLVDLVDQQNHPLIGLERLPQLAFFKVIAHIVDLVDAQLRVAQTAHGIVFVEALMRLGGGLDMPGDQPCAEGLGQLLGQHGLAGAGLTFYQQWALQRDRRVDCQLEIVSGDVCRGAFELHDQSLSFGNAQPVGADNVTGAGDARTITWLPDDCECRRLIQFLNGASRCDRVKIVTLLLVWLILAILFAHGWSVEWPELDIHIGADTLVSCS
ncbi:hypothetical protein ALQ59_04925 [Pseudomonas syringae pv. apii]|uniref:Uncharacterized protein n=1 Tax=Pseudomonas syringae pv. apii TaxID=81036 RepID=A0A3M3MEH9_9PSED|nr:hypothetical protein ALQ59_04925 [Pseudomonas syringae pv. apii]RMN54070.1 hypothetical protein ALQ58_04914 [Pseudomonas syringae pv. apii]RMN92896.1 hypothetical protein ALQ49_05311 [Pseudomonas syringae pv. apii]